MQPANLQHIIWQLLILLNALCISSAEFPFPLAFPEGGSETLKGLHRVKVITNKIPKYKLTSQQYNKEIHSTA